MRIRASFRVSVVAILGLSPLVVSLAAGAQSTGDGILCLKSGDDAVDGRLETSGLRGTEGAPDCAADSVRIGRVVDAGQRILDFAGTEVQIPADLFFPETGK